MNFGDEIKRSWKTSEERVVGDEPTISDVIFLEFEFLSEILFDFTDGARAMRIFAHDAIPPVEGAARRGRERDRFSVGFDGAGVHAALARGRQMNLRVRDVYCEVF
jgi:hypothetical protein